MLGFTCKNFSKLRIGSQSFDIPRGNTQDHVNGLVLDELARQSLREPKLRFLDLPAGEGDFIAVLKKVFPQAEIVGVEPFASPRTGLEKLIAKKTAEDFFANPLAEKFDVITCISGVMCFDGVKNFIHKISQNLEKGGKFILTNDNILTVRDRLSFLFFGRVKRFPLFYHRDEKNWNLMPLQALIMLLQQNNLKVTKIAYTPPQIEDWFFLPLALLLWIPQILYILSRRSHLTLKERLQLFPLASLLSRHYVIFADRGF